MMSDSRPTVVFAGYWVRYPLGGHVQAELSALLALEQLGYRVYFVEAAGDEWEPCYNPLTRCMTRDASAGIASLHGELEQWGLGERWCYVDGDGHFHGLSQQRLKQLCSEAAFLFSRAGCTWREEFFCCEKRIYLDVDPAFTQIKLPPPGTSSAPGYASVHDFTDHFTYASKIGEPDCLIPLRGLNWKPTWPVFVPELYQNVTAPTGSAYRTVMSWDAYGVVEWKGQSYGQKKWELPKIEKLPERFRGVTFELALAGGDAEAREALTTKGWHLVNANAATQTRETYLSYLAGARGEVSVAKHGYVATRSGWISDRTLAFLALGRPAIVQETGMSDHLPTGDGLVTFETPEEACEAVAAVEGNYEHHARKAKELVEAYFRPEHLVRPLLETAGL